MVAFTTDKGIAKLHFEESDGWKCFTVLLCAYNIIVLLCHLYCYYIIFLGSNWLYFSFLVVAS